MNIPWVFRGLVRRVAVAAAPAVNGWPVSRETGHKALAEAAGYVNGDWGPRRERTAVSRETNGLVKPSGPREEPRVRGAGGRSESPPLGPPLGAPLGPPPGPPPATAPSDRPQRPPQQPPQQPPPATAPSDRPQRPPPATAPSNRHLGPPPGPATWAAPTIAPTTVSYEFARCKEKGCCGLVVKALGKNPAPTRVALSAPRCPIRQPHRLAIRISNCSPSASISARIRASRSTLRRPRHAVPRLL